MLRATRFLLSVVFGLTTLSVVKGDALIVTMGATGAACTEADPCGSIQQAIDLVEVDGKIQVGAGTFVENLTLNKTGLTLQGMSMSDTIVQSAGGIPNQMAPMNVPVDIVVDVLAPKTKISQLSLVHPAAEATKRDLGIFVRPPAVGCTIDQIKVSRERTGTNLEPFMPGSRGLLVFRATGK